MFLVNGTIILRMPVKRGDLKGSIERLIRTVEDQHVSTQSGYVARKYAGFDDRYSTVRAKAKLAANETVAQAEDKMAPYLVERLNFGPHPQFRVPRMRVFRESQERYPLLLPCGIENIRTTFALTYFPKLTREGVQAEGFMFNSKELSAAFMTFNGTVTVKLDPDDIRTVLVILPGALASIEASLTTLDIPFRLSLELAKAVLGRVAAKHSADDGWMVDINHHFLKELEVLQTKPVEPTPGKAKASDATAAAHASNAPPVSASPQQADASSSSPTNQPKKVPTLAELLRGSEVGDDGE